MEIRTDGWDRPGAARERFLVAVHRPQQIRDGPRLRPGRQPEALQQMLLAFGLNEHYRQILELTRLDEAIGVHATEAAALAAVGAG